MFGLGMMEIGLIIAIAVMLFPAKELPKLARTVARLYGSVRKTAEDFKSSILDDEDLRSPIDEIKGAYNDARFEVKDAERKARQQLAKAQMELRMATARRLQSQREVDKAKELESADPDEHDSSSEDGGAESAGSSVHVVDETDGTHETHETGETDETDETVNGPLGAVASADPRVVAGRRSGQYSPRPTPVEAEPTADETKAREGVA